MKMTILPEILIPQLYLQIFVNYKFPSFVFVKYFHVLTYFMLQITINAFVRPVFYSGRYATGNMPTNQPCLTF
jgi:hypothetical protein